jgi:hypothetical protein
MIEVHIDGQFRDTVDLSADERRAQERVWETADLAPGEHVMELVHRGPGPVAVDALVVR